MCLAATYLPGPPTYLLNKTAAHFFSTFFGRSSVRGVQKQQFLSNNQKLITNNKQQTTNNSLVPRFFRFYRVLVYCVFGRFSAKGVQKHH
jgi:hypothetical protein